MAEASAPQGHPMVGVMLARAQQVRLRIALPLVIGPAFHIYTGWPIALAWVAAYVALQLLELWIFTPNRLAARLARPAWRRAALALVAANGLVFGAFGLVEAALGGASGAVCGALLLCGAVMNAVLTSSGSRTIFLAAMAPQVAYFMLLPFAADAVGGDPMNVLALALAAALNIWAASMAWRLSERILAAEQLARAKAEAATATKSSFMAMVSHELRTPISAILAGANEIERAAGDDQLRSNGALIGASARMMRALLNDLLDFSKMEAGRMSVEAIPFEPLGLVQETARFWSSEAAKKGVDLEVACAADLPQWVLGDPTRLRQILNNLLSNALKFTDAGSVTLRVKPEASGGAIAFSVADTGQGMTAAQLDRLFTPFDQLSNSTARTHGGTGLGLAISRQLARLMGGDLTATSQAGRGATFLLRLPLPACAPAAQPAPAVEARGLRILVADDHEVNRKAFRLMLEPLCERLVTAENGAEALNALEHAAFDLVLMDINMPVMGGVEAVRRLRASGGLNAGAPVVALTAAAGDEDRAACRAAGMDGFVAKPVEASELIAVLQNVLADAEQDEAPRDFAGNFG
jgi:signal transduction histidine kinase/ActR/RegA family two-component response regulator